MIKKFDYNYTPFCDQESRTASHFSDYTTVVAITDAHDLERRALSAERKLEIVFGNFEAFQKKHGDCQVDALLNHIEREFELEGLS